MALKTINDFDFGTGNDFTNIPRVGSGTYDVSKPERDFILWIMLEQEFYKAKFKRTALAPDYVTTDGNLWQTDGKKSRTRRDGDGFEETSNTLRVPRGEDLDNEKLRIAKDYAEKALRSAGINISFNGLQESKRHDVLLQLFRGCDFISDESQNCARSATEIFKELRAAKFKSSFGEKNLIGSGAYGEVFHVVPRNSNDSTPQNFAVKKISVSLDNINEDELISALNESKFLKILKNHENIVNLHDYWLEIENEDEISAVDEFKNQSYFDEEDEEGMGVGPLKVYIQLEFCGISLQKWKEENAQSHVAPEISHVLRISFQLFDGLSFIHQKGILHLDINPKNILWKDSSYNVIKIVDFGLAVRGSSVGYKCGTSPYAASENRMTSKSDVYSAAVTIVDVAKSILTVYELVNILKEKKIEIGEETLDRMLLMSIEKNPNNRPTANEVKEKIATVDIS